MDYFTIIASSALVSATVSGIVSIIVKNIEYKNDYKKTVIAKRLEAYEQVEVIWKDISRLTKDDNKIYHQIFGLDDDEFIRKFEFLFKTDFNLWISKDIIKITSELNNMFYEASSMNKNNRIKYAKNNLNIIDQINSNLAIQFINDMKNLHKVKKYFKIELPHFKDTKKL